MGKLGHASKEQFSLKMVEQNTKTQEALFDSQAQDEEIKDISA
jgi:hypothetical protein